HTHTHTHTYTRTHTCTHGIGMVLVCAKTDYQFMSSFCVIVLNTSSVHNHFPRIKPVDIEEGLSLCVCVCVCVCLHALTRASRAPGLCSPTGVNHFISSKLQHVLHKKLPARLGINKHASY